MVGTPRFGTLLRAGESFGKVGDSLEYKLCGDMTLILAQYLVAEVLLEIFADNEYNLAESTTDSPPYADVTLKYSKNPGEAGFFSSDYYFAAFAFSQRAANASLSETASSASIFLLRLMPASLRPCIKEE